MPLPKVSKAPSQEVESGRQFGGMSSCGGSTDITFKNFLTKNGVETPVEQLFNCEHEEEPEMSAPSCVSNWGVVNQEIDRVLSAIVDDYDRILLTSDESSSTEFLLDSGATIFCLKDRHLVSKIIGDGAITQADGSVVQGGTKVAAVPLIGPYGNELVCKNAYYNPSLAYNIASLDALLATGHTVSPTFDKVYLPGCSETKDKYYELIRRGKLRFISFRIEVKPDSDYAYISRELEHLRMGHTTPLPGCKACMQNKCRRKSHAKETRAEWLPTYHNHTVSVDLAGPFKPTSVGGSNYYCIMVDRYSNWVQITPIARKSDAHMGLQAWIDMFGPMQICRSDNGQEFAGQFLALMRKHNVRVRKTPPYTPEVNGSAEVHNRLVVQGLKCLLDTASMSDRFWAYAAVAFAHVLNRSPRRVLMGETSFERAWGYKPSTRYLRVFGTKCTYKYEGKKVKLSRKWRPGFLVGYGSTASEYLIWDPQLRKHQRTVNVNWGEEPALPRLDDEPQEPSLKPEVPGTKPEQQPSKGAVNRGDTPLTAEGLTRIKNLAEKLTVEPDSRQLVPQDFLSRRIFSCGRRPPQKLKNRKDVVTIDCRKLFPYDPDKYIPNSTGLQVEVSDALQKSDPTAWESCLKQALRALDGGKRVLFMCSKGRHRSVALASECSRLAIECADPSTTKAQLDLLVPVNLSLGACLRTCTGGAKREILLQNGSTSPVIYLEDLSEDITETVCSLLEANPEAAEGLVTSSDILDFCLLHKSVSRKDAFDTDPVGWQDAEDSEHGSLKKREVYESRKLADLPPGTTLVPIRLLHDIKESGRLKCRAVVLGNRCPDVDGLYSPVPRLPNIRLYLKIAMALGFSVEQFDIKTAFLYADLDGEEVWCKPPPAWRKTPDEVWRLKRALYGLPSAPRHWTRFFSERAQALGWTVSDNEPCCFFHGKLPVMMLCYVDDILFLGRTEDIAAAKKDILAEFEHTTVEPQVLPSGEKEYTFLGMRLRHKDKVLTLSQPSLVKKLVDEFDPQRELKPADTPITKAEIERFEKAEADGISVDTLVTAKTYRKFVGTVMYLQTCTRYDIGWCVMFLSTTLDNPPQSALQVADRLLRYLIGTKDFALKLSAQDGDLSLTSWSDADWATCKKTRKSVSGGLLTCGTHRRTPIFWRCRKQEVVALSTAESEIMAATEIVRESIYLKRLLCEALAKLPNKRLAKSHTASGRVRKAEQSVVPVYWTTESESVPHMIDNQAAKSIAESTEVRRVKHLELRQLWIRDAVHKKLVKLEYCRTDAMLADVLTKPLNKDLYLSLCRRINP